MAQPNFMRDDLAKAVKFMMMVEACYDGEPKVQFYLLDPNPPFEDATIAKNRLEQYTARANYYNVTRRTGLALLGLVFAKTPVMQADDRIDTANLIQQSRKAVLQLLVKGRAGLMADYPVTARMLTQEELKKSGYKPTIKLYQAQNIINWQATGDKLQLVVLQESYEKENDGFSAKEDTQLVVLRMIDGMATSWIWRQNNGIWRTLTDAPNIIKDQQGKPFDELPFTFLGAENNDPEIDDSPLYDLAKINLAHYRNSADYEEALFIAGQPTLFISGVTEEWQQYYDGWDIDPNTGQKVKGDPKPITLGSRTGHLLGTGAKAELVQADPNNALFSAMQHKESQMIALGAKLIDTSISNKTATEASAENAANTSILANIANNASDGYMKMLGFCERFVGAAENSSIFTLNTNFMSSKMSAQDRQQLMQEYMNGLITFEEMRAKLVEDEIATETDAKKAKSIIENDLGTGIDLGGE